MRGACSKSSGSGALATRQHPAGARQDLGLSPIAAAAVGQAAVDEDGVLLTDGTTLQASTVVCTIGTMQNPLADHPELLLDRGRIMVNADLSVPTHAGAWAVGDCARIRNVHGGMIAPPTAQFAIREARCLAENLLATIRGQRTKPFGYRQRGSMAAIGHRRA